jgi:5-methylcytosine-specific restriction endonuclease McrA
MKNNVTINNVDDMLEQRDLFLKDHHNEMVNEAVTLCSECHNNKLHKIYGKSPSLGTAKKQKRWVDIQRNKRMSNGVV